MFPCREQGDSSCRLLICELSCRVLLNWTKTFVRLLRGKPRETTPKQLDDYFATSLTAIISHIVFLRLSLEMMAQEGLS